MTKKFKVCLDLGNGAQSVTAKTLCEKLGCIVYTINEEINGDFPGRGSEPTPQNLDELSKLVVETNSNLGIAFDGDGDRSIFCDECGKILTGSNKSFITRLRKVTIFKFSYFSGKPNLGPYTIFPISDAITNLWFYM